MSQSPLARSTRKSLPAFAHPPSRLSKSTSIQNLKSDSPSPSPINTPTNTPTHTQSKYKNVSSSTTPSTPKILYSPYATSSPHAGPSRSASIPFDMAASARDARRKSLAPTPNVGREDTPIDSDEMDNVVVKNKRRAIMRKKPIFTRIKEYPQYLLDRFQYDIPSSILDILPPTHLANPIALGIHAIQYLLLAPILPGHGQGDYGSVLKTGKSKGRWERFEDDSITRGRSMAGLWTGAGFTILILLSTLGNATYLFSRFKTYDMQLRSAQEPVKSPHASPISAPRATKNKDVFDGIETEPDSDSDIPTSGKRAHAQMDGKKIAIMLGKAIWLTTKFIFAAAMSAIGKPTDHTSSIFGNRHGGGDDKIQSLRVWEPPSFCLAFFCAIPPTAPLLTYILTPLHPLLTPLIHLSITFLLSHLATSYAQLVKDRQLLSAEVMREYDQRFVYRRVFASRVDRGTQTNEAESVW